jgi:two-component system, OmpR family, response regulator
VSISQLSTGSCRHAARSALPPEFRLLALFVQNPARVLSRDEIARIVQEHDWSPLDRTLGGHVARLRRKLEGPTDEPSLIKSVRTVGYVFASEVSLR